MHLIKKNVLHDYPLRTIDFLHIYMTQTNRIFIDRSAHPNALDFESGSLFRPVKFGLLRSPF